MRRAGMVERKHRRWALWSVAVGAAAFLLAILYSVASAAPVRPLDDRRLLAEPSEVIVTNWPTPVVCASGYIVGSHPDCPQYIAIPTVTGQEGRGGLPVVVAGNLPGTQGLLMLIALGVLFVGGMGIGLGFLYVFVIRPGGGAA